jgi:hypothetical protein
MSVLGFKNGIGSPHSNEIVVSGHSVDTSDAYFMEAAIEIVYNVDLLLERGRHVMMEADRERERGGRGGIVSQGKVRYGLDCDGGLSTSIELEPPPHTQRHDIRSSGASPVQELTYLLLTRTIPYRTLPASWNGNGFFQTCCSL